MQHVQAQPQVASGFGSQLLIDINDKLTVLQKSIGKLTYSGGAEEGNNVDTESWMNNLVRLIKEKEVCMYAFFVCT
jgi:hypothetical protein